MTDRKALLHIAAFCLVIVALCYANSIPNEFIGDDYFLVALNPAVRSIDPIESFTSPFWGEKGDALGIYRPVVVLSYSLEYSLWQRWTPGYHIVNLLLHALNGVLVWFLARSFSSNPIGVWAAAGLYLAHPVHTEAVAAIAGRSELLSATFFFSAWLLFRQGRTALCAIVFLFSLLSKENAISFGLVVALGMWLQKRQFEWKRFVPLAASVLVYLGLRFWVLGAIEMPEIAQYVNGRWTLIQRELTSGRSFLKYFELLLAPIDLAGNYDFNSIPIANPRDLDAWLGLALVAATIVLALVVVKRHYAIGFGILFFYATMFPMSNWVIPTGVTVAERYLYVPVFGFALIAGTLWSRIHNVEIRRLVAGGILTISALLCISHNYVWREEFTYYQNMVRVLPNNARGRQGYGVALLRVGRLAEARAQFEAGLRVARNTPLLVGLAGTLIQLELSCKNAVPLLDEALRVNPKDYFGRWALGECFDMQGEIDKAEAAYRRAIDDAQFPEPKLLMDWAESLERTGRQSEALEAYRRAALIDPDDTSIKDKLAGFGRRR